ncbi:MULTISPECIES: hypothetical protein [Halocynthiibacter]|uniref:Uncharacterized protein n=1 Tax=Halocynthiibacter halioticoli TaxID=2986804 RepID=A0AAE3J1Q5_9RHOB|nr:MULTISPECIES: hypothetical protein [Halocynthiibacter]MCV6825140.1 hypothetical protein [Halocynthiibacter halioticoli]MCW4058141.1 hypothetical protein [Halocynthiibacter sp. SDUM655004]
MSEFEDLSEAPEASESAANHASQRAGEHEEDVSPLAKVGEVAHFNGTVKSFLGLNQNLEDSLKVAAFAASLGIDLYRKDRSTMSRLLGGLSNNAWIAATWPELKHSKHLPSEYFQDSRRVAGELTYYASTTQKRRFAMLTYPALNKVAPADGFDAALKGAKAKAKKVRQLIDSFEGSNASVIFERLEGVYRPKERAIFWHFHVIVEIDDDEDDVENLRRFLGENSKILSSNWAAVNLKQIDKRKFSRVAFYIAKPCRLAVEIAEAEHGKEFADLFTTMRNRRMTGRWNGFQQMCRKHKAEGVRVAFERDDEGREIPQLVEKTEGASRKQKDAKGGKSTDAPSGAKETIAERNSAIEGSHDNSDNCQQHNTKGGAGNGTNTSVAKNTKKIPAPEYLGLHGPISGPGNRLYGYIRVRDFSEAGMKTATAAHCWWNIKEDQEALVYCWEENTGETYDLRKFLEPFAQELWELLGENKSSLSNIYRPTITASADVIRALEEILFGLKPIKKSGKRTPKLTLLEGNQEIGCWHYRGKNCCSAWQHGLIRASYPIEAPKMAWI